MDLATEAMDRDRLMEKDAEAGGFLFPEDGANVNVLAFNGMCSRMGCLLQGCYNATSLQMKL